MPPRNIYPYRNTPPNRVDIWIILALTGVDGDWLEAADAMCNTLVLQRRREILKVYRDGWRDNQSVVCPQATNDCPDCPETVRCACRPHYSTCIKYVLCGGGGVGREGSAWSSVVVVVDVQKYSPIIPFSVLTFSLLGLCPAQVPPRFYCGYLCRTVLPL